MTKNIMTRVVSSCIPCLLLFIALPNGSPQLFAEAQAQAQSYIRTPSSSSSSQHEWLSPPKEHTVLKANNNNNNNNNELLTTQSALADLDMTTANTTTTNTTTTNTTSQSPTPPPAPTSPTPPPTSFPTKKYESPEDEKEEEKKKEESKVGGILGWIVLALLVVGCVYFRDAIIFFLVNVWNSTRRYGCKGCLKSCFPWFFGSELAGGTGGGEPLDQIIFEAEDPTAPLMS